MNFIVVITKGSNIFSFEIPFAKFAFVGFFIIFLIDNRLKMGKKLVHSKKNSIKKFREITQIHDFVCFHGILLLYRMIDGSFFLFDVGRW